MSEVLRSLPGLLWGFAVAVSSAVRSLAVVNIEPFIQIGLELFDSCVNFLSESVLHHRLFDLGRDTVFDDRPFLRDVGQRDLAALLIKLFVAIETVARISEDLTRQRNVPKLLSPEISWGDSRKGVAQRPKC